VDLRAKADRLDICEVKIRVEDKGVNYVAKLKDAENPEEVLAELDEVRRDGLVRLVDSLYNKSETKAGEIYGKEYQLGVVDPKDLLRAKNYFDFFKILLQDHPSHKEYANSFLVQHVLVDAMTEVLGPDVNIQVSAEDAEAIDKLFRNVVGKGEATKNPKTPEEAYPLLCILRDDFIALGERISYERARFLKPYFHLLFNKREDKRRTLIGKMLNREYPFTDDRRPDWPGEIQTFQ